MSGAWRGLANAANDYFHINVNPDGANLLSKTAKDVSRDLANKASFGFSDLLLNTYSGFEEYGRLQRLEEQRVRSLTAPSVGIDNVNRSSLSTFLGANNTLQLETQSEKEARLRQDNFEQEQQDQKLRLESFKAFKSQQLSFTENFFKVEQARLKSHLDYTTEAELKTARLVAGNEKLSLQNQIAITENYYNNLLKFGELDKEETLKTTREKNAALYKLSGELRVNEFNTQKEILSFEKRIADERRQSAIEAKKLQIEQSAFGFDNQIFDVQRLLSSQLVSAQDGFDKLVDLTQKSYQETSRLTSESYQLQLQNLSLTKEQRLNLTTEMYFSERKLAEENSRKILQIEDDKFQKSFDLFKQQNEQIIKLS